MKHTKEQRKAHMKQLRASWSMAKQMLADGKLNEIEAIITTHGMKISPTGFMFMRLQLIAQDLDGLPYLDAKTFRGWKESGFTVKKGEHSTLSGITWILADKDNENDRVSMFPKEYKCFHRSQVEAA